MSHSHQMYTCNTVCMCVVDTLLTYLMVELILLPVTHYFIIISCMHDYSPFTSVLTTQYLFVPLLYPCSVVVLFRCYILPCTCLLIIQAQSYNAYRCMCSSGDGLCASIRAMLN